METETLDQLTETNSNPRSPISGIEPREWIGVVIVISLAVLPDLQRAIQAYQWAASGAATPTSSFADTMYYLINRSFFVCAITCVAILMLGRNWSETGFKLIRLRDPMWGFGFYLAGTIAFMFVTWCIPDDWFFAPNLINVLSPPSGPNEYPLLLAGSIANGMGEELVVRGYLISRLEALTGSTWLAVLATTAMFASYHIYQGGEAVIGIFAFGLVFAYAFVRLRSIWPVFIAHAIADFVGLMSLGTG